MATLVERLQKSAERVTVRYGSYYDYAERARVTMGEAAERIVELEAALRVAAEFAAVNKDENLAEFIQRTLEETY